jgi:hypothetical protein
VTAVPRWTWSAASRVVLFLLGLLKSILISDNRLVCTAYCSTTHYTCCASRCMCWCMKMMLKRSDFYVRIDMYDARATLQMLLSTHYYWSSFHVKCAQAASVLACSYAVSVHLTQTYAHAVYYAALSCRCYSVPTLAPHMLGGLAAVAAIMKRQWRSRSKIIAVGIIWILLSSVDKRHR